MSQGRWQVGFNRILEYVVPLAILLSGCDSRSPNLPSVSSPNGQLSIVPSVSSKSKNVLFVLLDSQDRVVFRDTTGASDVMRWSFHWEGDDAFILDSSDIGTVRWQKNSDGDWLVVAPKEIEQRHLPPVVPLEGVQSQE